MSCFNSSSELSCDSITDEDDPHCVVTIWQLCYKIIDGQTFQIQTMRNKFPSKMIEDCLIKFVDTPGPNIRILSKRETRCFMNFTNSIAAGELMN